MPPSYRRRYYNYYRPSSGYSRWTRYSSRTTGRAKRRAIGNLIAANAQKDATQVNLSITTKCAVKDTTTNINGTNFQSGAFAINVWDLLRRSEFYQSYANMYDQVKIDSIKVKLTPVQWTFNSSLTNNHMNSAITIGTAWDRTGLTKEQLIKAYSQFTNTKPILGTEENSDGIYLNIGEDIWTYSSLITRNLNPGSSVNLNRALYPSSISEKGFYVNTSELKQWYEQYDYNKCRYYGITEPDYVTIVPSVGGEVVKSDAAPTNPCYLQEDSTIPFKPTLLIGVRGGVLGGDTYIPVNDRATKKLYGKEAETVISPVIFNVDFDVGVTFRGLRKAPIVADNYTEQLNIQDNKTVEITEYLDNKIIEPDEGYDVMKQVTINVNIPQPPQINIEQTNNFTLKELNDQYVHPSEGYQAMHQLYLSPLVKVYGIGVLSGANPNIRYAYFSDFTYCSGQRIFRLNDSEMLVILYQNIIEGQKTFICHFTYPRGDGYVLSSHAAGYYGKVDLHSNQQQRTPRFWFIGERSHKLLEPSPKWPIPKWTDYWETYIKFTRDPWDVIQFTTEDYTENNNNEIEIYQNIEDIDIDNPPEITELPLF